MFTGLIQCVGKIKGIAPRGTEATITVDSAFHSFTLGESIAVNGTCLSVTHFSGSTFSVYASAETLAVTGINQLTRGSSVNLEKALTLSTPLGGHLVTGHVDTRVRILQRIQETSAAKFQFALPADAELKYQIAPKGSVTINGVSLTVNSVTSDTFEVMIIPVTLDNTTLGGLRAGDTVNLETDILAKYISRRFQNSDMNSGKSDNTDMRKNPPDSISAELLMQHGFMR